MSEPLLEVTGLAKSFGGVRATDAVDLSVGSSEVHALIGPNGAGKTTLISQLSGLVRPDAGTIRFAGRDITRLAAHARAHQGLARSFQITSLMAGMTVIAERHPRRAGPCRPFLPLLAPGGGRRTA